MVMHVHKYTNSWMTNKQMRKFKNMAINRITLLQITTLIRNSFLEYSNKMLTPKMTPTK